MRSTSYRRRCAPLSTEKTKGGQITGIERDQEHGQTIYEVEFSLGDKEYELDISPEGQLLERRLD